MNWSASGTVTNLISRTTKDVDPHSFLSHGVAVAGQRSRSMNSSIDPSSRRPPCTVLLHHWALKRRSRVNKGYWYPSKHERHFLNFPGRASFCAQNHFVRGSALGPFEIKCQLKNFPFSSYPLLSAACCFTDPPHTVPGVLQSALMLYRYRYKPPLRAIIGFTRM